MPPINTIVVQTVLLPPERQDENVLQQAKRLLVKTLYPVEKALEVGPYLIGEFSAADIMLGHACFMSNRLGCVTEDMPELKNYVNRIDGRVAFKKAFEMK